MKQPPLRRASLESFATPTASRTIHHPHHATITQKPELKKRSSGELSPDDPRFIGYAYIEGEESNPGTTIEHTCNVNYTLSTSGSFYSCCPTSTNVCSFATNCIGSSWELFPGGTISRCSSECATGTIYTATNDNSPLIHVGCGYENYYALRNGDTNLLGYWDSWDPPEVSAFPTIGWTATESEQLIYGTPTPGQVFDPPTEAVWGPGTTYQLTYHFTKVTGAIAGSLALAAIIVCCFLGRWKRRRDQRKPPQPRYANRQRRSPFNPFYNSQPTAAMPLPAVELQRYDQAYPNRPISPAGPPPPPQQYPVPEYQIFQPQAQRQGYQHVLRDEGEDREALVREPPPGYVESVDDMTRGL
ncbi:hypothetical protein V8E51_009865 [Hyaloscypha variabilis]